MPPLRYASLLRACVRSDVAGQSREYGAAETIVMRQEEISRLLATAGAIRHGHFELSSGLHSATYVQCALVLQYPRYAEMLGRALASEFHDLRVDCVASPALGGVILGQEVARALSIPGPGVSPAPNRTGAGIATDAERTRAIFVERDSRGELLLRRGFQVERDEHVLVVEDVWTTGGSTFETIRVIEECGGRVIGVGALIDRSGGRIEFPVRAEALLDLRIDSFEPDDCPLCRSGSAVTRPGSRFVRNTS